MNPVGVVLAGGRSSRMGTDKALLAVDGVTLVVRVATVLAAAGCDPVVCQGGDREALARLGLVVVPDSDAGSGPLPAIVDALSAAAPADVVISACDLPGLDPAAITALLAAAADHPDVDVVAACDDGGPHLVGFWRGRAGDDLARLVAGGLRSYRRALELLGALTVAVPSSAVINVNRPEDLP